MTLLGHGHRSQEQQQELREARRILKECVRSDWDYPTLPSYKSTGQTGHAIPEAAEDTVAGFRFHFHGPHDHDRQESERGLLAQEWRQRECSSDSDGSDNESVVSASSKSSGKSSKKTGTYRFEGPESVGPQIQDRRTARKRKRQKDLEVEMGWNEGLAHWMSRRDAWCGAHTAAQVRELQAGKQQQRRNDVEPQQTLPGSSYSVDSEESESRTSTSSTTTAALAASSAATTPDKFHKRPPATTAHPPPPSPSSTVPQSSVLLPIATPILPNHPIRRRITPSMYNEIYTKIILQSRTPSVPINLLTLIAALVQGWKDDGEWPPKTGPLEPSIGKRRGRGSHGSESVKNGVRAVGRVLRLTGTGETSAQTRGR
ncbi:hypothetical protein B0A50_01123 [Salinomyces thailandicus]|uniref:Gag1-like clamp domain-containing protein n=1 Tax=Salinomyces thailandicus TaxID=706561 RepID=A0A4U0UCH9_9PEZI|nr:hypothetical protein B0A50_01123 [Salinomyces thailandica]